MALSPYGIVYRRCWIAGDQRTVSLRWLSRSQCLGAHVSLDQRVRERPRTNLFRSSQPVPFFSLEPAAPLRGAVSIEMKCKGFEMKPVQGVQDKWLSPKGRGTVGVND
jgi:hypothetical protein